MRVRDPDKEHAIREKALEMIVAHGFDGLSMQKLAKAAGVSPATIYIYFKSRDDLIVSLFREEQRRWPSSRSTGFDPEMSFADGLRLQWINRARYCLANPKRMHFMEQIRYSPFYARESARHNPFTSVMRDVRRELHPPRRAGARAGRGLLGHRVRAALPAGEVPHARARPARQRAVRARREDSQPHLELGAQGARTLETNARQ